MNKLTKLEALRGLVSLYVACAHTFNIRSYIFGINFTDVWRHADVAVFIFFIISGFVIQLSYERGSDKSFKFFFAKRFLRIYIPLILVFAANFFLQLFQDGKLTGFSLPQLLTNLFMLEHLTNESSIFFPLFNNGPLWTLAYEWWYYMLFFLIVTFQKKYASFIVYGIFLSACILSIFTSFELIKFFVCFILWWIGADIAKLYIAKKEISFKNLAVPIVTIVAGIVILRLSKGGGELYNNLLWGFIIISVALIWHKLNWKFFDQTIGRFLPLASTSYTLYISHWFMISYATYLSFIKIQFLPYILYFAVCFAFCYLVERIIYPRLNTYFLRKTFPHKYLNK